MQPAVQQAPLGLFRWAILIGLLPLLLTLVFSVWAINQRPNQPQEGLNLFARTDKAAYYAWPPLEDEKRLYLQNGYDLSWMESAPMLMGRSLLGPYAAFIELIALRLFGLSKIIPLVLLALCLGFAEGRIQAGEKITSFGNISATRFKWAIVMFSVCIALSILFVTLPFGSSVPFLGTLPLVYKDVWLTSPHYWAIAFSLLGGIAMYQAFSNLSIEV